MKIGSGGISRIKIPAILGGILLFGGLVAAVYMVGQSQGILTKAGPTSTPRQVKVTNVKEDSFTVSWISDTRVTGFVKYGEEAGKLTKTIGDDRDQISGEAEMYTTHFVTVKGLKPKTNYYFKLGSGSKTYGEGDSDVDYTTSTAGLISTKPSADVISGKVLLPSGQPAPGVIVYVDVPGGSPLSALTKTTGSWTLTLSMVRTPDLATYLDYDRQNAILSIVAQGADLGSATATVPTSNDSPVPDITLGQTLDLSAAKTGVARKEIEIKDNLVTPSRLEVMPGEIVTVINKDGVPHSVTAKDKEFDTGLISGGGNATFSAPIATGDYPFEDTANPGVESLTGVIAVKPLEIVTPAATPSGAGFGELIDSSAAYEATLSVKLLNPGLNGEDVATSSPEIKIKGPAGTTVKITVNSQHTQTDTITLDADGLVEWTPPSDLEPGEHTVTLEYVDGNGVTQTVTRTFTVLAEAPSAQGGLPAFTSTPSATPTVKPTATPSAQPRTTMPSTSSGVPEPGVFTLTLALLMMGVGLFFGGLLWQIRRATI